MKRIAEIHIFEHQAAGRDTRPSENSTQSNYREQPVTVSVRYVQGQNLAYVVIRAVSTTDRALIPTLLPVGAPEECSGVHVEAVISGRLKELGSHRAGQLAEYVVGHVTSVCNPGVPEQPGFTPRYDFPQSGAPAFLRSCAIESCGVPHVMTDKGVKITVADDIPEGYGARFTPAEPQGEMT